ncbi:MAG: hypothetical protein KKC42_01475 [Candidatus Omnitrophica bacterium]|nr:hypothetical protein [Candidatus Omnitrophota bacterium]
MKDKEKIKVYKEHDLKNQATIEGPVFKSRFKSWIRTVAFIVVAVFLPEQAAWAIEYSPATFLSHLIQVQSRFLLIRILYGYFPEELEWWGTKRAKF